MYLAFYDESGDDGYPRYSSPLFVLSACYVHYLCWKETHEAIHAFRRLAKERFGLPVNYEIHTKEFLLGKNPYRALELPDEKRVELVGLLCDFTATLRLRFVNVVIVKPRIVKTAYNVLDSAFSYSIQRIENDLKPIQQPANRFMIITDPGRVGMMRKTARRVQRINFIPSVFGPAPYRCEVQGLIEDPLPKDSKESYFIQLCDLVATVVYLHVLSTTDTGKFHGRMPAQITSRTVTGWLERLRPSPNLEASVADPYGLVIYPR